MNVAYFENRSMITKMASYSPTFGRCVMKSSDTFSKALLTRVEVLKVSRLWISRLCPVGR